MRIVSALVDLRSDFEGDITPDNRTRLIRNPIDVELLASFFPPLPVPSPKRSGGWIPAAIITLNLDDGTAREVLVNSEFTRWKGAGIEKPLAIGLKQVLLRLFDG